MSLIVPRKVSQVTVPDPDRPALPLLDCWRSWSRPTA
jgi:hypothetical protein